MSTETDSSQSPSLAALAAALAKAQGQMSAAKKDALNPHFKSKYADLASIWDACRDVLSANGLAVIQRVGAAADSVCVTTMLVHSSGEWVKDTCVMPVAQRTPQGVGSAITYARRYALSALVGVAAEDDDGNAASGRPATSPPADSRPANGTSRTEAVKAKLKAVVDVKAGETEAEATARTAKEQAAKSPPRPQDEAMQAMLQLSILQNQLAWSGQKIASFIRGATGKADRTLLNLDDVQKVKDAIAATMRGPPADPEPPPHNLEEPPPGVQ
jgi:hypothetical protein